MPEIKTYNEQSLFPTLFVANIFAENTERLSGDPEPSVDRGAKELFKAVGEFCKAKTLPSAAAGTKIYNWTHSKKRAKKDFVFYAKDASSVRNKQDELTLNISVFTIGRNLQFLNCHKFVMFPDRHQTEETFNPRVSFNQNYVSRALEKLCPALHLHLLLEPPPDFVKVFSWTFNLNLVQTLWCWLSNVEIQTRRSRNRRSDSSCEIIPKECGLYAWKKNL